jgi:hypothetical protein
MRRLLIGAAVVGLSACAAAEAPPVVFANTGWRTSSGAPVSVGEFDALVQSCAPRGAVTPIDSDQPVANPLRDNPAYHPGGEGLTSAPPTGIAAADRRTEAAVRRSAVYRVGSVEDCLSQKGLVKTR